MKVRTIHRPKVRNDSQGQGHWQAKRGSRKHNGVDLEADVGSDIISEIEGTVTKLGFPYSQKSLTTEKKRLKAAFRYVQITDKDGYHHRFFYVNPSVLRYSEVKKDTVIGTAQDLTKPYPGMDNHVHYEVVTIVDGKKVFHDPNSFIELEN